MIRYAPRNSSHQNRRGMVTLWTLLAIPLLFTVICAVAEVGHLWQARVQLENALEAAALAAVQEWAEHGGRAENIHRAEAVGRMYAQANGVHGRAVELTPAALLPDVRWTFGVAQRRGSAYDFKHHPNAHEHLAVRLAARMQVPPLFSATFGHWLGCTSVSAATTAYFDRKANPPRARLILVH